MTAQGRWEGFRGGEESGYTGAHFSEGIEDAVEDDEEGKDRLDGPERAAQDEAKDTPAEETESHGLFAAYTIHEEAADYAAGEVEAVHHGLRRKILALLRCFPAT